MKKHAGIDNLVIFAVLLGVERVVALMAINNEQPMSANNRPLCMLRVLQPLQAKLTCCLAVLTDCNSCNGLSQRSHD